MHWLPARGDDQQPNSAYLQLPSALSRANPPLIAKPLGSHLLEAEAEGEPVTIYVLIGIVQAVTVGMVVWGQLDHVAPPEQVASVSWAAPAGEPACLFLAIGAQGRS